MAEKYKAEVQRIEREAVGKPETDTLRLYACLFLKLLSELEIANSATKRELRDWGLKWIQSLLGQLEAKEIAPPERSAIVYMEPAGTYDPNENVSDVIVRNQWPTNPDTEKTFQVQLNRDIYLNAENHKNVYGSPVFYRLIHANINGKDYSLEGTSAETQVWKDVKGRTALIIPIAKTGPSSLLTFQRA